MSHDARDERESIDAAVEDLLRLADDARRAVRDGDTHRIAALVQEVRTKANGASGPLRALHEVAEAFLRALSRGVTGGDTLTLLRFIEESPEASAFIAAAASAHGVSREELEALPDPLPARAHELLERGVLVAGRDRLTVRPGLRPVARDLVVPPVLRMWKQVQNERSHVALSPKLSATDRARALAAMLGITEPQAKAHLAEFPLHNALRTAARPAPGVPRNLKYQRPPWTPHGTPPSPTPSDELDEASELVTVAAEAVPSGQLVSHPELN